jgi:hypothetical protein
VTLTELHRMLDTAVAELPADVLFDLIGVIESTKAKALVRLTTRTSTVTAALVDAEAVATALHVPVSQVYELARQKRIPRIEIGKYVRFDLDAVRSALTEAPSSKTPSYRPRKRRSNGKAFSGAATTLQPPGTAETAPEAARG